MKISVVIPALNEEGYVGDLLFDLRRQTEKPEEVFVVDAGSSDGTVAVAESFPEATVLRGAPPVARGRNLGGFSSCGEVVLFLDADARLEEDFLENFVEEFERRKLDVACPIYIPYGSTPAIRAVYSVFNALFRICEGILPSGSGACLGMRGDLFRGSRGFDPGLKCDDAELLRRLSRGNRFAIVGARVGVCDRRFREEGFVTMFLRYSLMGLFFAFGRYRWANGITYEFGAHDAPTKERGRSERR